MKKFYLLALAALGGLFVTPASACSGCCGELTLNNEESGVQNLDNLVAYHCSKGVCSAPDKSSKRKRYSSAAHEDNDWSDEQDQDDDSSWWDDWFGDDDDDDRKDHDESDHSGDSRR